MSLDLSEVAKDIISSLGSNSHAQLVEKTSSYDPITRTESAETITKRFLNCAVVSIDQSLIDGTRIKATDSMLIADNAIEPKETDFIEIGGIQQSIVQVMPINHAGTVQAYKVVFRV